jgi:hypothetical protein
VICWLSQRIEHDHGAIGDPENRPYGNGVLLWFEVDDFDAVVDRAAELEADIGLAPRRNPPEGQPGRLIVNCEYATPTATPWCWRAPTGRRHSIIDG